MPNIKITLKDGTTKTVRFDDGFTEADIEEVARELNNGLSPQEPKQDYKKLSFKEAWNATPEELNENIKALGRQRLQQRQEWEQKHPVISETQKAYQPHYRSDLIDMQNQAKYGLITPVGQTFKSGIQKAGQELVPSTNIVATALTGKPISTGKLLPTIANTARQGGIQAGVEGLTAGLADNGLSLQPLKQSLINAAIGGSVGGSLPVVGTVAKEAIKLLPKTGGILAKTIGRVKPESLTRAVQPDSKALDLTEPQAQNLLMDTTERVQNTYKDLLSKRGKTVGEAIKALPADKGITRQDLKTVLENIYSDFSASGNQNLNVARNEAGGLYKYVNNLIDKSKNDIVSASEVKDILKNIKSHAPKDVFGNPISSEEDAIINLLYGDYNAKLSTLSPELAQANKSFKVLKDFEQNEGVKEILRPNKKDPGTELDKASRALKNYNSTVTKGNTNRNIQDLEKVFVKAGEKPFLKDIDDVNAAMDLLNARSTGDSWLANLATQATRPALKIARRFNQLGIPQFFNNAGQITQQAIPPLSAIVLPVMNKE